ncbi:MAG: 2-dehydropantoate 2-reductase [Candidatus Tectimicrobiota bacterium]|nr:MAG: 2-dehydropantoate 2-reductase [Candidatus Tectomicrobia bacterium]
MRFVICGAGALGGVLGGQLAKAGYEVVLIDKIPEQVAAINRHGLQLRGVHGNHTLRLPAVPHAREVAFRPGDVIFLCVKSFHTEAAVRELRQATDLDLPVFCAQNGVRNEEVAARFFSRVHGVMVLIGAKCLTPGVVVQTGNGPLGMGAYPEGLTPEAQAVAAAFDKTDLTVYTTPHIMRHKWNKLLHNLNNATMALTGLGSQEARAHPEARLWMAEVCEEGLRVLQAAGIAVEGPPGMGSIAARIAELRRLEEVPEVPKDPELMGYASMWQDLYHRRGVVEADFFNGEIVCLGQQYGVPTPYNRLLLELVKAAAAAQQPPGQYTIAELRQRLAG